MKKKFSTSLFVVASLMLLAGTPGEAGRRHHRSRAVCVVQPVPCVPCTACQGTTSIPFQASSSAPVLMANPEKDESSQFKAPVPCVCAEGFLFSYDGDDYYSATRYYPDGLSCTDCDLDYTYLVGNYTGAPFPCGHERCEPDITSLRTNAKGQGKTWPVYRGTKKIDWNFDPTTDSPAHVTTKVLYQEIRSFLDVNRTQRLIQVYYMATYNQRTRKSATLTVGYELLPGGLSAEQLKTVRGAEEGESIVPIDQYGRRVRQHTYVYVNDAEGAKDDVLYFLRNDVGQAP